MQVIGPVQRVGFVRRGATTLRRLLMVGAATAVLSVDLGHAGPADDLAGQPLERVRASLARGNLDDAEAAAKEALDRYVLSFRLELLALIPRPSLAWGGESSTTHTQESGPWANGEFSCVVRSMRPNGEFIESELRSASSDSWKQLRAELTSSHQSGDVVRKVIRKARLIVGSPGSSEALFTVLLTPFPGPVLQIRGHGNDAASEIERMLRDASLQQLSIRCDPGRSHVGTTLRLAPSSNDALARMQTWEGTRGDRLAAHVVGFARDFLEGLCARRCGRTLERLDRMFADWTFDPEVVGMITPLAESTVTWRRYSRASASVSVVVEVGRRRDDSETQGLPMVSRWSVWRHERLGERRVRSRFGALRSTTVAQYETQVGGGRGRVLLSSIGDEASAKVRALLTSADLDGVISDPD